MTFVDTNVLLDLVGNDPRWGRWSIDQLDAALLRGPLLINFVVYAELAARYQRIVELDAFVAGTRLQVVETPRPALFLASRAHLQYRQAGGTRTGVLPDFFIGAHAAVLNVPLLTRDARRYRSYFPRLELIGPGD